jgi:hypothetical protein
MAEAGLDEAQIEAVLAGSTHLREALDDELDRDCQCHRPSRSPRPDDK